MQNIDSKRATPSDGLVPVHFLDYLQFTKLGEIDRRFSWKRSFWVKIFRWSSLQSALETESAACPLTCQFLRNHRGRIFESDPTHYWGVVEVGALPCGMVSGADLGWRIRKSRMLPTMMTSMMMKSVGPALLSFRGDDGEVVMGVGCYQMVFAP